MSVMGMAAQMASHATGLKEMKWQDKATLLGSAGLLGFAVSKKVQDYRDNRWMDAQFAQNDQILAAERRQRRNTMNRNPSSRSGRRDL